MPVTYKKTKIGKQDVFFDASGTGLASTVDRSDGTTRTVDNINASHIPSTTTTRAKKNAADAVTAKIDVDGHIQELYDDVNNLGVPDDVTVEVAAGVLRVKDLGISTAKLATDSVDNTILKDDAVTDANRAVTTDHIRDSAIDPSKLATDAVETAKIKDLAVTTAKIALVSVGKAQLNVAQTKKQFTIPIEDLAQAADFTDRAEFVVPTDGVVITKVGICTKDPGSAGIDGSNTVVIDVKNKTAVTTITTITIITDIGVNVFNDSSFFSATLNNQTLSADDVITIAVTQGTNANMGPFLIILEFTQTDQP